MWWAPIAAAGVSALGNIAGGLFGGKSGGKQGDAENFARQQLHTQMQKSVQWRVQDAREAGVHPLAALGAQISASPPVPVGGDRSVGPDIGSALSELGQGASRALTAYFDRGEKNKLAMQVLQIEGQEIDNQIKLEQLKQIRGVPGSPPDFPDLAQGESFVPTGQISDPWRYIRHGVVTQPLPAYSAPPETAIPGQGGAPAVKVKPVEVSPVQRSLPHQEAGAHPQHKWIRQEDGWVAMPTESSGLQDLELDNPYALEYWLRNRVLPVVGTGDPPPDSWLPKEATGWWFDTSTGRWKPHIPDSRLPGAADWLYRKMPWYRERR